MDPPPRLHIDVAAESWYGFALMDRDYYGHPDTYDGRERNFLGRRLNRIPMFRRRGPGTPRLVGWSVGHGNGDAPVMVVVWVRVN